MISDPAHWGGGLETQSLSLWTATTFAETGSHVITLTTGGGNGRIISTIQKVGHHECARIPEARPWAEQRWDSVQLALLRSKPR